MDLQSWLPFSHRANTQENTPIESFVSFSETVHQLLDENQRYLSKLTSMLQDATQEMEHSVMVWYTGGRECVNACKQIPVVTTCK